MFETSNIVKSIRKYGLLLFLLPVIAITCCLLLSNHLAQYGQISYPTVDGKFGPKIQICDQKNNFCFNLLDEETSLAHGVLKFTDCSEDVLQLRIRNPKNKIIGQTTSSLDGNPWDISKNLAAQKKAFKMEFYYGEKDSRCIKHSLLYPLYKSSPLLQTLFLNIQSKTYLLPKKIFPFVDGETSISRLVREYPSNYIFKPIMLIVSVLMMFYWISYNKLFFSLNLNKNLKKEFFLIFGLLSASLLIIHVIFLGVTIEIKFYKTFRRLIIILFILSEVLAQFFLVKKLYQCRKSIFEYVFKEILFIKFLFVFVVIIATFFSIYLVSFTEMTRYRHNILEWNYFFGLLFFYIISRFMWKKPSVHIPEGM